MKTFTAADTFKLAARSVTPEGFLVAPATLARTGIQDYRAFELGLDGMAPDRIVKLWRPASEVFAPDSMASFEGKPVTIEHPAMAVDSNNWAQLAKGEVRGLGREGDFVRGTIVVKSKDAIEAVMGGKVELSNGYTFQLDWTPGKDDLGNAYDGVQRNIRGNHVAIVDAARCGAACRISDSTTGVLPMADAKRKVVVDGLTIEADETAASAIDKLNATVVSLTAKVKDAEGKLGGSVTYKLGDASVTQTGAEVIASLAAKDAEIAALRKDVMTPAARDAMVADWVKTLETAKRLAPAVTTDGKTCMQIRREVIAAVVKDNAPLKAIADAVLAGVEVEKADETAVRTAFNTLAVSAPVTNDSAIANAFLGATKQPVIGDGAGAVGDAHALFCSNFNHEE